MTKITILIADDHSIMRMGLKAMFDMQSDMTVVGEAANGKQAVELATTLQPDVVIMDLMMPEIPGDEATRQILSSCPSTKIIILTSFGDSANLLCAIRNGAVGFQAKEDPAERLLDVIRSVAKGEVAIPRELLILAQDHRETSLLTDRQTNILHYVDKGLTNKDIARLTGISPDGVKKHMKLIFAKTGAANRAEAVSIALKKHLLKI